MNKMNKENRVAPYAGAWIEIQVIANSQFSVLSLLMQERGLKFGWWYKRVCYSNVAPYAGAWIEIL